MQIPWLNRHLLLNFLSLAQYRKSLTKESLLADFETVSTYLTSSFYLEGRTTSVDANYFLEWFAASTQMMGSVAKDAFFTEVSWPEVPDDPLDLKPLAQVGFSVIAAMESSLQLRPSMIKIAHDSSGKLVKFSISTFRPIQSCAELVSFLEGCGGLVKVAGNEVAITTSVLSRGR